MKHATGKEITAFSFDGTACIIDQAAKTISVEMPYATVIEKLVAEFTVSDGATVKVGNVVQTSGVTENDFTTALTYSVYSEEKPNSDPAEYTVTVTRKPYSGGGDDTGSGSATGKDSIIITQTGSSADVKIDSGSLKDVVKTAEEKGVAVFDVSKKKNIDTVTIPKSAVSAFSKSDKVQELSIAYPDDITLTLDNKVLERQQAS